MEDDEEEEEEEEKEEEDEILLPVVFFLCPLCIHFSIDAIEVTILQKACVEDEVDDDDDEESTILSCLSKILCKQLHVLTGISHMN